MPFRQLRGDSMYYCLDCESTFDSEDTVYIWERGEFWGAPFNYNIPCCPYCKSDNIKNIEGRPKCDGCHNICIDEYIETSDERHYCRECYVKYTIDD